VVTVQITLPGTAAGNNADAVTAAARIAERLHAVATDTIAAADTATEAITGAITAGADVSTTVALLVDQNGEPERERDRVTTRSRRAAYPRAVDSTPRRPPLRILTARREALLAGTPLTLTRREYDLLLFLAGHPGRVFTRPQLLKWVWGHTIISGERTVDVHVRRLRAKLKHLGPTITTVRGIGYRLDDVDRVAVVSHRPAVEQGAAVFGPRPTPGGG